MNTVPPQTNIRFGYVVSLALALIPCAHAAVIQKADTADNLNIGTSWVGGLVPTNTDVALWDNTVATPANTVSSLGADLSFLGLSVSNPAALVSISAGNILTLGSSGIDMSGASQSLSLACGINLGSSQIWNIGAGVGLTNVGAVANSITGTGPLLRTGPGTLTLTSSSNTYSGGTFLAGGTNVIGSVLNGHFGTGSVTLSNNATLMLFSGNGGDPGGGGGSFANPMVIPPGQTATLWNHWRGTCSGPVTGSGTLNLRVNGVRGEWTANWSGFTGQLNVTTRTGADDFRINVGGTTNTTGLSNCIVNLMNGTIMYKSANPPNGGVTASTTFQPIGALTGSGATLSGNLIAGRFVNWQVGFLNLDTSFAGRIADNTGATRITKVGTGSLTLSGTNTYSGSTTILNGKLVEVTGGSASNSVSTVLTNGTFGLLVGPNGNQWVGTNLIFANGANLELNFAGSTPSATTAPLLVRGNLSLTNTVYVKILGGNWGVGAYPLVKYTWMTNGGGFAALALTNLPLRVAAVLSNDTVNSSIDLVVTSTTEPLRWATGDGIWDVNTTANWVDAALASTTYNQSNGFGDTVQFEDTQSVGSPITVTLNSATTPAGVAVNSTKTYTISGTGSVGGFASLTKAGSGTLTVSTTNTYAGGSFVNGGILNFSVLENLGGNGSPISFGGGTLQYASGNTTDISVRPVTFNGGGGAIDTAGNNLIFANGIGNNGAGGLTKTGLGRLTLSRANPFFGSTIVSQGILALAAGAGVSNSSSIVISNGAILDVSAAGLALNGVVSQALGGTGSVVGNVTSGSGSSILPGSSPGTITFSNDLAMTGGTIAMDISTNLPDRDLIIVNGALTITSGNLQLIPSTSLTNGTYKLLQTPGGISGSVGSLLLLGFAQPGQIAFLSDAVAGEIDLVVATGGTNNLVWQGDGGGNLWDVGTSPDWLNGANASIFNQGDGVNFDNTGSANPTVGLAAAIYPSNVTVNATSDYTLQDSGSGVGKLIGPTRISKSGSGKLTLLTVNNNTGPTVISGGTVQLGNGTTTTGSLGNGNITNNGAVVFAQTDDRQVNGLITGTGPVVQQGAATLSYTKDNNYGGGTTISSGTLQVGVGGAAGLIGTGPVTNAGTLIFNRSGAFTVTNGIAGTGTPNPATLVKLGSGTMTLGGINTYEGNTFISNGVVKLGASEVIPDGGATTGWLILDGGPTTAGTLDLNGFNETVNALQGLGGTVLGQVVNNAAATTNSLIVNSSVNTAFAGLIRDNTGSGGVVSLIKNGSAQLTLTGNGTYTGGTIVKAGTLALGTGGQAGTGGIILSNGTTFNMVANGTSVFPPNTITTEAGGTATFLSANLANGLGGNLVSGDNLSTNSFAGPISASTANVKQFQGFTGTVVIQDGFQLRFSSTTLSVNGGDNTTFYVGNASTLNTRNGFPAGVGGGNGIYLGALVGVGNLSGAGNADGATVYVIGGKGIDCTFSGVVSGAAPRSTYITKVGPATLTFDGTLSYEGSTTVSNGVLAVVGTAVLDSSTNISVKAGASLYVDPSGTAAGTLSLGNTVFQTLSGAGTIRGSLTAYANSTISPGDSIGTLTVTNAAALGGTIVMELNRTNAPTSDQLLAQSISYGGTLTVTNIGPPLRVGDTFQLFSGALGGTFAATNLPALSPCLSWNTSSLNTLGRISVTGSLCPPTLTNLVLNSTSLQISWGSDYIGTGWVLQAQTNAVTVGLKANWVNVTGSAATNLMTFPISSTNVAVFYRLAYQ